MTVNPVTSDEVYLTLLQLKSSTSCNVNNVQIKPVKYVLDVVTAVLTYVFSLCISYGVFTNGMQAANARAIYKKCVRNDLNNYRQVFILPVFSKGFEKRMLARFESFIEKTGSITDSQNGFRNFRSTQLALLDQKEYNLTNIANKKYVLGIFLDFTKGFDYLNRSLPEKFKAAQNCSTLQTQR